MLTKIRENILNFIKKITDLNDSCEFKPLLCEIEDKPISPLGRFTFWVVTALILITLLWLIIGKIDIVVNARGVVIPDGEAKIIQSFDNGVITNIKVKEGDFVKKGQLLIDLDSSTSSANLETVSKNLEQSKLEARRLKANGIGTSFNSLEQNNQEVSEDVAIQQKLYKENQNSINNSISARRHEIAQLENQINSSLAQKRDYEFQYKSAEDRERRLKNVIEIIAYNDYQQAVDRKNSLRENIVRINSEILRLRAQQAQIRNEIAQMQADFKIQNLDNFAVTQKRINELEANKEQLEFSNKKQKIVAPCDGYIDELMVHTIGGIVTPAQELIALTPAEKPLMIKAKVINRDIGFIKIGMPVSIKIDTFDFQKYGILHGTISSISQNSIEDKDLGLIYEVYIKPTEDTLLIDNKEQKISTGMTLNAEIEIGKRRIIEFFIYPLIKYLDEGISVR